jgi:hypothetical protein
VKDLIQNKLITLQLIVVNVGGVKKEHGDLDIYDQNIFQTID